MDDLLAIYETAVSEGGDTEQPDVLSQNATVHQGDDESSDDSIVLDDSQEDTEDTEESDDTDEVDDDSEDVTEDVFDFDAIKDKLVEVQVGGQTFEVPLAELRNGYMRQSDYTRKTQALAKDADMVRWAQELQSAFQQDPNGTLQYLAGQLGVKLAADEQEEFLDPDVKPIVDELKRTQRELDELRRRTEQFDQERVNREVQAELESMRSRYSDFDPHVVLPIAIETGLDMEKAYKLWKADQMEAVQKSSEQAKAKAESAAARREKARKAASKVSKGATRVVGEADDSWKQFDSFEDIFAFEVERSRS